MYKKDFSERLTKLRMEKDISARDMSLSLGQSESYINRIENQKMLPSMAVFFYICEFLGMTPSEFFNEEMCSSKEVSDATKKLNQLNDRKRKHIIDVIHDL